MGIVKRSQPTSEITNAATPTKIPERSRILETVLRLAYPAPRSKTLSGIPNTQPVGVVVGVIGGPVDLVGHPMLEMERWRRHWTLPDWRPFLASAEEDHAQTW
jgi:hypothetical protein